MGTLSASAALLLPATASLRNIRPTADSEIAYHHLLRLGPDSSGTAGEPPPIHEHRRHRRHARPSAPATDTATLAVNDAPVLTAASPSLGSTTRHQHRHTTTLTASTSFINTSPPGPRPIDDDADSNAVLGGIALTGTTGKGTWAY